MTAFLYKYINPQKAYKIATVYKAATHYKMAALYQAAAHYKMVTLYKMAAHCKIATHYKRQPVTRKDDRL
jgi:hypothetical protein